MEHEPIDTCENRKPILVTGAPRSGTTWTGQMISRAPGVGYIHEPFTLEGGLLSGFANPLTPFLYITDENSRAYDHYLARLVNFRYPLRRNLLHATSVRDALQMLWIFKDLSMHRRRKHSAVVKDPLAVFSAPWLAHRFDMNVVVTIRNPAAVCSSMKVLNWKVDFNVFLAQPQLIRETRLGDFESEIRYCAENEQDIILEGALLWNCIYAVVDEYRRHYPTWLFVTHEDLSMDPIANFRKVYAEFGLEFTEDVRASIAESTSGQQPKRRITLNPLEQVRDDEFNLRRNSRLNVLNWKNRLSEREIVTIKERTRDVASLFYADSDW
ncbi:sulfotransferase domain-containing protein [Mycobacterium sp. THU-M116]